MTETIRTNIVLDQDLGPGGIGAHWAQDKEGCYRGGVACTDFAQATGTHPRATGTVALGGRSGCPENG